MKGRDRRNRGEDGALKIGEEKGGTGPLFPTDQGASFVRNQPESRPFRPAGGTHEKSPVTRVVW